MRGRLALIAAVLVWANLAQAQDMPSVMQSVRIEQHVGQQIPSELQFTDEQGKDVVFGQYTSDRPAIVVLSYFTCPNLCPMLQRHLTEGLNGIGLVAGRDFDVIVASIDP